MARVLPLPAHGAVFLDARGGDRVLRLSWHHEVGEVGDAGMVVLSLWREGTCAGTFRLTAAEVPALVHALAQGLAEGYDARAVRDAG